MMPGESKEAQDAKHVASMRRTATDNPTSIYRPTGTGAGWGWGMAALDGKPFYTWFDVPRMIRDPRVRFLERMWRSPFQQATWTVKATHPKVQQYVDSQLKKFWRESLPALLQRYFWFGFAPGGAEFSQRKGLVRLDGVRPLEPLDARPLLFHGGPHDGRMAGLEFGTTKVYLPHAFWFSGEKRFGPYYDMPPAGGMFEPWAEKRGRNGAIDMRRTWFHKNSSRGIVVRHPPGRTESSDEFPGGRDNQSIARELIDYSETNSSLTLTNEKHPSDPSHFAWEVEWPESFPDRAGFREYPKDLDAEMAEGVGIPREVLEAAATGSGYSGRQIPLQAWLGGVDEYVGMLLRSCEWLKWAVMINFGPNAYFEVETESLVKKLLEDSKGPGGMGGAVQNMVNPQPQPGGDAQGKIPPGMVPYKGPRGGGGYEDPNTGRRRYLSDERSPSDELSEEQIARRVAKMLLRKHREEQAALELSDGRTQDLPTYRKQLLVLLAMLEFQRRAHAVGDSASSAPYLEALTQYLKNPNSLRYPLELSWRADETRTGHIRAVGEAEHAGRVLYGARAEAALRAQEGLRSGLKPGERAPKTPTPHANRDQWQKAGLRAREILAKVAGYEHTPEDLQELGQHLPYLPMDRLMNARSILRAKFKGARGRLAQVGALMDHIREQVGVMDQKATEEAKVAEAVGDAVPVHPLDYLAVNHGNPEAMAGKKQDLAVHDAIAAAYRGEFGDAVKAAVTKGGHWDNHGGDIAKRFASIGKALAESRQQQPKEQPAAPQEPPKKPEDSAADVPGFAEGGNLFDKLQFDTDDRPEAVQGLHTILGHAKQFVPGIGAPTAKHAEKLAAYAAEAKRYDAKAKELEERKKSGAVVFTKRDAGRLTDYKRWADDARKNAAKLTGGAAEVDDYLDQLVAVDKHAGEDEDSFFSGLSTSFRSNAEEIADIDVETHAEAQEHVKDVLGQAKKDFDRLDRTRKDIIQDLSLKGKTDLAEFYSRHGKEAARLAVADLEKRAQEKLESHKQRDEKNKAEQDELERKNGEEADAKIAEHNARLDEQDREPSRGSLAAYDDPTRFKANVKNGRGVTERDVAILDLQDAHESVQHFQKRIADIRAKEKFGPLTTAAKNDVADFEEQLRAVQKKKAKAAKRLADLDQSAPQEDPAEQPVGAPEPAKKPASEPVADGGAHPALAHLDPVKHAREAAHVDAGEDALLEKARRAENALHAAREAHRTVGNRQPERRNATKALSEASKAYEAAQAEVQRYNQHRPNHNARLNGVAVDETQPLFVRIAAARQAMGGHTGNTHEEILPHVRDHLAANGHDPRVAEAVATDAMNFPMRSAKKLKEVIQGEETRQKMYDERKEAREHIKGLGLLPHHAAEAEREAGNLYQGDVDRFKEKWSNTAENTKAEKARQVEAERIAKERAEKENASKSAADAYLAAHRDGKTLPALAPDAAREVANHVLMAPTQWHAGTELPKADGPKGIVDRLAKESSTRFALAKTITEQGWGTDSKYAVKATPAMVEHAKAKGLDKVEGRTPPVEDFIKQALAQNLSPAKIVATKQKAEDGLPDVLVQSEDGTKQATLDGRYVANIMGLYPKATMQVAGDGKPVVFMVGSDPVGLVMPRASGSGDDERLEQFSPHTRPQFADVFAPGVYAPEDIEEMGDAVVAGRGDHAMRLRILGRKGGGYTISSSYRPADNVADREYPTRGEAVAAAKEMLAHAHGTDEDGKLIFKAKGEKAGDLHPEEKARVGYYKDLREKIKAVKGKPQKMATADGEKEVHPATEHFGVAKGKTGGWETLHLPSGLSIGDWARKEDAIGHAIATQGMPGANWGDKFADTDDEAVKSERKELFDRARKLRSAFENNELPEHAKPTDQPDEPGAGEAATPKQPKGPSPTSATSPAMAPKAGEQQTFAGWMPGASTARKADPLPASLKNADPLKPSVAKAAASAPTGWVGDDLLLINHAYKHLKDTDPAYKDMTLDQFKDQLIRENGKGVTLSRADLPQALDANDVRESEVQHPAMKGRHGGEFHFIKVPKAGGAKPSEPAASDSAVSPPASPPPPAPPVAASPAPEEPEKPKNVHGRTPISGGKPASFVRHGKKAASVGEVFQTKSGQRYVVTKATTDHVNDDWIEDNGSWSTYKDGPGHYTHFDAVPVEDTDDERAADDAAAAKRRADADAKIAAQKRTEDRWGEVKDLPQISKEMLPADLKWELVGDDTVKGPLSATGTRYYTATLPDGSKVGKAEHHAYDDYRESYYGPPHIADESELQRAHSVNRDHTKNRELAATDGDYYQGEAKRFLAAYDRASPERRKKFDEHAASIARIHAAPEESQLDEVRRHYRETGHAIDRLWMPGAARSAFDQAGYKLDKWAESNEPETVGAVKSRPGYREANKQAALTGDDKPFHEFVRGESEKIKKERAATKATNRSMFDAAKPALKEKLAQSFPEHVVPHIIQWMEDEWVSERKHDEKRFEPDALLADFRKNVLQDKRDWNDDDFKKDYPELHAFAKKQDAEATAKLKSAQEQRRKEESKKPSAKAAGSSSEHAYYNGKPYKVLYVGPTKFGKRARLQFLDGSKDFWVDAHKVQLPRNMSMTKTDGEPAFDPAQAVLDTGS